MEIPDFEFLANDGQPAPYPSLAVQARNGRVADHTAKHSAFHLDEQLGDYA